MPNIDDAANNSFRDIKEVFPTDPFMLLSAVNMRLRDEFDSLEALCEDLNIDPQQLAARLAEAGFVYLPQANQFR